MTNYLCLLVARGKRLPMGTTPILSNFAATRTLHWVVISQRSWMSVWDQHLTAGWSLLAGNELLSYPTDGVIWFNLRWPLVDLSTFFLVSARHVDPSHWRLGWNSRIHIHCAMNERWRVPLRIFDMLQPMWCQVVLESIKGTVHALPPPAPT